MACFFFLKRETESSSLLISFKFLFQTIAVQRRGNNLQYFVQYYVPICATALIKDKTPKHKVDQPTILCKKIKGA